MFDALLAESFVSEPNELLIALAVLAVAGGLLLGYFLAGAPSRAPERQESASENPDEPQYAVVLHNDDFNSFGFVIGVLGKVFAYGGPYGFWLSLKVHCTGRSVIWTGALAAAEVKAEEVRAWGADPNGRKGVQPLVVSVEPLTV
jgi:ATP-dependent Clp protease adapter protein ClpS